MDKQKQIEEMASVLIGSVVTGADSTKVLNIGYITAKELASILINAGYRKIPENAVVLTREEYKDLSQNYVKEQIEKTRKETAKKFAEKLKEKYGKSCSEYYPELITLNSEELDEICKEITEVE